MGRSDPARFVFSIPFCVGVRSIVGSLRECGEVGMTLELRKNFC
jgi:hypothetical protein